MWSRSLRDLHEELESTLAVTAATTNANGERTNATKNTTTGLDRQKRETRFIEVPMGDGPGGGTTVRSNDDDDDNNDRGNGDENWESGDENHDSGDNLTRIDDGQEQSAKWYKAALEFARGTIRQTLLVLLVGIVGANLLILAYVLLMYFVGLRYPDAGGGGGSETTTTTTIATAKRRTKATTAVATTPQRRVSSSGGGGDGSSGGGGGDDGGIDDGGFDDASTATDSTAESNGQIATLANEAYKSTSTEEIAANKSAGSTSINCTYRAANDTRTIVRQSVVRTAGLASVLTTIPTLAAIVLLSQSLRATSTISTTARLM